MFIKLGDTFKKFSGFQKKAAESVHIIFDNSEITCSLDHRFKTPDNQDIYAKDLKRGSQVKNTTFSISQVIQIENVGVQTVFTPLEVDGELYETLNGVVHHNCSFIGSSNTLISGNVLEKLVEMEPVETMFEDLSFSIYKKPEPGHFYLMGCDPCAGVGGDYACIQVIEIFDKYHMEQVATYRSNTVKPGQFARIIDQISKMYNNAYFIVENNDPGKQVVEELWYTLENPNLINTEKAGKGLGTKSDKRSKLDACLELQRVIDAEILTLHDGVTISELSRFEEQSPNVFKAAKGNHDDTVSALYWAIYATLQPEIDMDNIKIKEEVKQEDNMTVDMMADALEYNDDFWSDFK